MKHTKILWTSLLLVLLVGVLSQVNGLGAVSTQSTELPVSLFNTNTCLYSSLPFGSAEKVFTFANEQIDTILVILTDASGNEDYERYDFFRGSETLKELAMRTGNLLLQHWVNVKHFPVNQRLTIDFNFESSTSVGSQTIHRILLFVNLITFIPVSSEGVYVIPSETINLIEPYVNVRDPRQSIPWASIRRATLRVLDQSGKLTYVGDTKTTGDNDLNLTIITRFELWIGRKYFTNGCSGVLTVTTDAGTSAMYNLNDGTLVLYPQTIPPLVGVNAKSGKPTTISVNGAPLQKISLFHCSDISLPPYEELLTLDNIGSATWTSKVSSSMEFFTVKYR